MKAALPTFSQRLGALVTACDIHKPVRHALTRSAVAELFAVELYGQHRI